MKVKIKDQEFIVRWKHWQEQKITYCHIYEGKRIKGYGTAFCSKNDQFIKEMGRKVSLKRALSGYTKEQRTIFWQTYHNR